MSRDRSTTFGSFYDVRHLMSSNPTQSKPLTVAGIAAPLAALLMLLLVHLRHPLRIGFDQAFYVYAGSLLLQGKSLYVDIVDINPPMISYLSMIPAWLSSVINIPAPLTFSLCIWILSSYCTGMVFIFLAHLRRTPDLLTPAVIATAIPLFNLLMQSTAFETLHLYGQREHLFILGYLPYFCLRFIKLEFAQISMRLSILVGLIAGVFLCLKPYFFLVAIIVETFWLIERKNRRLLLAPETISIAAVAVIYLFHFGFLPSEVNRAYFDGIAAVGLAGYKVYDVPTIYMLNYTSSGAPTLFIISIICTACSLALTRFNQLIPSLCALSLACYFNYLIQSKGWPLHILPLRLTTFCLGAVLCAILLQRALIAWRQRFRSPILLSNFLQKPSKTWMLTILVFACSSLIFFGIVRNEFIVADHELFDLTEIGYHGFAPETDLAKLSGFIRDYSDVGDAVAILNNSTEPAATLLLQLRRKPAGRHIDQAELWYFEYIRDHFPELWKSRFEKLHNEYMDALMSDIVRSQPSLILVRTPMLKVRLEEYGFTKRVLEGRYKKISEFSEFEIYVKQNSKTPL